MNRSSFLCPCFVLGGCIETAKDDQMENSKRNVISLCFCGLDIPETRITLLQARALEI